MTQPEPFTDLEIHISKREDAGYPVEIVLAGQRHFQGSLSADVLPWVPDNVPAEDGQRLLDALFADSTLREAWVEARGQTQQRRIRLRIDEGAPELHALPWELLRDGDVALAANADTPFSRYLPCDKRWGQATRERPVQVLAVVSNPDDLEARGLPPVDVTLERSILVEALADTDEVELTFLEPPVTPERLEEKLREGYHALHFVGHGAFDVKRESTTLYLQDSAGNARRLSGKGLVEMLVCLEQPPRLVCLVACQSAKSSTANALTGLAPKLVLAGLPAVVAMRETVTMDTARLFAATLYRRLAAHGVADLATNEARKTLLTAGRPDAGEPALYMRLKGGQLWEAGPMRSLGHHLPPNPFSPLSGRISNPDRVFDREREINRALDLLRAGSSVALIGPAGVGKSSLLTKLMALTPERLGRDWEIAYLNLQSVQDEEDFYEALCSELEIATCSGYALARALRGRCVLLCLDEIEAMTWEGFSHGPRAQLRGLAEGADAPLKLVLAARTPLDRLFPDSQGLTSPLANICLQVDVGPWKDHIAGDFLRARLVETGIALADGTVAQLLAASRGHPGRLMRAAFDWYADLARGEA